MRSKMMAAVAATILAAALFGAMPAGAAEHEVKMLNKGAEGPMAFEPSFLAIAPGDTVRFVAADKGHNVLSIEGMSPDGAAPFSGKMNEDITSRSTSRVPTASNASRTMEWAWSAW